MGDRKIEPELLDDAPPEDAAPSLRDIARLNSHFGGHAIVRKLFEKVASPKQKFSVLDVGAASGDTARVIRERFPAATVVSLDRDEFHLKTAPHPKVVADAFRLPFASQSFDFVFCSLFLHHFRDIQIIELFQEFLRVSQKAVLVSDLERNVISYVFLPATKWIFGWHWLSIHDGKISVRAALTAPELRRLALSAGLTPLHVQTHRPAFRISLIAVKSEAQPELAPLPNHK